MSSRDQGSGDTDVRIERLTKVFFPPRADPVVALLDVDLDVPAGQFLAVVGPSGCGKSTLLGIVAGLDRPSTGYVAIAGRPVLGPYTDAGIVFQRDLLLEWRTCLDNVLLQFELRGLRGRDFRGRAMELLELVGIADFAKLYPRQLSGGMRQRVSLCRALAHDPNLLLMDEPFGALDALTREQLNIDLARISSYSRKTVVFITHSIAEAVFLADRVVVMSSRPGHVVGDISVDLPRPRRPDIRDSDAFLHTIRRVRRILSNEGVLDSGEDRSRVLQSRESRDRSES